MRAQRNPPTTQTRSLPPGNVIVLQSPVPLPCPLPYPLPYPSLGCNLIFILKKPIYICAFVAPLRVLQRFFVSLLESQVNEGIGQGRGRGRGRREDREESGTQSEQRQLKLNVHSTAYA